MSIKGYHIKKALPRWAKKHKIEDDDIIFWSGKDKIKVLKYYQKNGK